jgi:hypothetical protein
MVIKHPGRPSFRCNVLGWHVVGDIADDAPVYICDRCKRRVNLTLYAAEAWLAWRNRMKRERAREWQQRDVETSANEYDECRGF